MLAFLSPLELTGNRTTWSDMLNSIISSIIVTLVMHSDDDHSVLSSLLGRSPLHRETDPAGRIQSQVGEDPAGCKAHLVAL